MDLLCTTEWLPSVHSISPGPALRVVLFANWCPHRRVVVVHAIGCTDRFFLCKTAHLGASCFFTETQQQGTPVVCDRPRSSYFTRIFLMTHDTQLISRLGLRVRRLVFESVICRSAIYWQRISNHSQFRTPASGSLPTHWRQGGTALYRRYLWLRGDRGQCLAWCNNVSMKCLATLCMTSFLVIPHIFFPVIWKMKSFTTECVLIGELIRNER